MVKRTWSLWLLLIPLAVVIGLLWMVIARPRQGGGPEVPGIALPTSGPGGERLSCTYPLSYWAEHPERYPSQVWIGREVYGVQDIQEALNNTGQGLSDRLVGQLLGSFLNALAGADQSAIETIVFEAYAWLAEHADGGTLTQSERANAERLLQALVDYNLGNLGVSACPGFIVPTQPGQPTGTATFTRTPTSTGTATATATGTLVSSSTPLPFRTSTPTRFVTDQPARTPTRTPPGFQPTPTSTSPSLPPTATATRPPAPTATNPPPPTATATQPSAPTPTVTEPPVATATDVPPPTVTEPPPTVTEPPP